MRKLTKVLFVSILVTLVFQNTLNVYAQVTTMPVPPGSQWVRAWNTEDSQYNLKLRDSSDPTKFPWVFSKYRGSAPLMDAWGLSDDSYISHNAEIWRANNKTPLLFALVDATPELEADKVVALCSFEEEESWSTLKKLRFFYDAQRRAVGFVNIDEEVFTCLLNRNARDMSDSDDWISNKLNDYTEDNDTKRLINTAWNTIKTDQTGVFNKGRSSGDAPLAENTTTCAPNGIKPMFFRNEDSREQFDERIIEIKETLISDTENDEVKQWFESYFGNENIVNGLYNTLNSGDEALYKKYYGDPGTDYPTVVPSDGLNNDYQEIYQEIQNEAPIGEGEYSIWQQGFDVLAGAAVGALAMLALAPVAASGYVLLGGTAVGLGGLASSLSAGSWSDENITGGALSKTIPLFLKTDVAGAYLLANEQYNECLADQGDPYGMPNSELAQLVTALRASASGVADGIPATPETDDPCSGANGGILSRFSITGMIRQAFCGMSVVINDWANDIFLHAIQVMQSSLGVSTPVTNTTTSSSSTSSESTSTTTGDDEAGSELTEADREHIRVTCNAQKPPPVFSFSESQWAVGPCVGEHGGYALDVITNQPALDDQLENQCNYGEGKIELSTDCVILNIIPPIGN